MAIHKQIFKSALLLLVSLVFMSFKTADEQAVEALARRVMGSKAKAVAFEQIRQLLERTEELEAAVRARRGLALFTVQTDEEGRTAVFLGKTGGDDAHHALMPRLVRQNNPN